MKSLKNFALLLLVLMAAVFVLESCKKGEEDPAITLKSRKARLAGEYLVSTETFSRDYRKTDVSSECRNFEEERFTFEYRNNLKLRKGTKRERVVGCKENYAHLEFDTTHVYNDTLSFTTLRITFDRDGNFSITERTLSNLLDPSIYNQVETYGTWNFMAGVGDVKNKEYIILTPTELITTTRTGADQTSTTVRLGGSDHIVYGIKQLKSSEIILFDDKRHLEENGDHDNRYREIMLVEE